MAVRFQEGKRKLSNGPVVMGGLNADEQGLGRKSSANVIANDGQMNADVATIVPDQIAIDNAATWALYQYTPHLIDLDLLAADRDQSLGDTWPDDYDLRKHPGDVLNIGGGNKLFVECWRNVAGWAGYQSAHR